MRFVSTRNESPAVSLSEAVMTGLAPDGGLYVPDALPQLDVEKLNPEAPLATLAPRLLAPFFAADELRPSLEVMCESAFNFPLELNRPHGDEARFFVLDLFHGPTAAFKDFGARFLAECLTRLKQPEDPPFTILVATSGDTGGAVAAAFDNRPEARVVVMFPEGRVSSLQQHQLSCWSRNVLTLAVKPDFDACQALAKQAFADEEMRRGFNLTSANSINIARVLAQLCYHAWAALRVHAITGEPANVIIPTGNLGNALACVWAKIMGLPIGRILCATNANETIPDYFLTGRYTPRASVPTIANAMDVGAPSNFERLMALGDREALTDFGVSAVGVSNEAIRGTIARDHQRHGLVWCPHTAAGLHAYHGLVGAPKQQPWVLAATAHASKFPEVVEPVIARPVELAPPLKALLDRPAHFETMDASLPELLRHMREGLGHADRTRINASSGFPRP